MGGCVQLASFDVNPGEVVGFFGLVKSRAGCMELVCLLYGAEKKTGDKIQLESKLLMASHLWAAIRAGFVFFRRARKKDMWEMTNAIDKIE